MKEYAKLGQWEEAALAADLTISQREHYPSIHGPVEQMIWTARDKCGAGNTVGEFVEGEEFTGGFLCDSAFEYDAKFGDVPPDMAEQAAEESDNRELVVSAEWIHGADRLRIWYADGDSDLFGQESAEHQAVALLKQGVSVEVVYEDCDDHIVQERDIAWQGLLRCRDGEQALEWWRRMATFRLNPLAKEDLNRELDEDDFAEFILTESGAMKEAVSDMGMTLIDYAAVCQRPFSEIVAVKIENSHGDVFTVAGKVRKVFESLKRTRSYCRCTGF